MQLILIIKNLIISLLLDKSKYYILNFQKKFELFFNCETTKI